MIWDIIRVICDIEGATFARAHENGLKNMVTIFSSFFHLEQFLCSFTNLMLFYPTTRVLTFLAHIILVHRSLAGCTVYSHKVDLLHVNSCMQWATNKGLQDVFLHYKIPGHPL